LETRRIAFDLLVRLLESLKDGDPPLDVRTSGRWPAPTAAAIRLLRGGSADLPAALSKSPRRIHAVNYPTHSGTAQALRLECGVKTGYKKARFASLFVWAVLGSNQ
jgi:hypothetical protein